MIEMMIALTIGLVILAAMTSVFVNSSHSQMAAQNSAQQIENGRYALDTLTQELHLAGYYGEYATYSDGTTLPDPCATGNAATLQGALGYPVQAIIAQQTTSGIPTAVPDLTGTSCATYLPAANLYPGSDILVVRHADTSNNTSTTPGNDHLVQGTDTALTNEVYIQANEVAGEIQFGNGGVITTTSKADGSAADIFQKGGSPAAYINKYLVRIFFVAPCSRPNGGGSVCTGASDDAGSPIPTLKMLELSLNPAGSALTFNVIPIAEGVEALKVEFGIDNSPTIQNSSTGRVGDGVPDLWIPNSTTSQPGAGDYPSAVAVKLWLITRDSLPTQNYSDTKKYPVATPTSSSGTGIKYGPYNDGYKRHAYDTMIRLLNMSARRETP